MTSSNNLTNSRTRLFRRLALLTVVSVYLIVIAGGVVRSTGSGMGCPDWPKCFGQYIPPTDISQLPPNYQEIYGAKLKGEVEFNAVKTWIEYVNRLIGAFSGLLVFATLLLSINFFRSDRPAFYGSLGAFCLIGFNGWLGSRVVATELAPYMVTIHMLLALGVIFTLLYVYVRSSKEAYFIGLGKKERRPLEMALVVAILLSAIQVVLGTQVRELMDEVIKRMGESGRAYWIDQLGLPFYIHRSFSILVLGAHVLLLYRLRNVQGPGRLLLNTPSRWLMGLVILEILSGVIMAYMHVPAFTQPVHLTLAFVILGLQFVLLLRVQAKVPADKVEKSYQSIDNSGVSNAIH